jgi:hypothetical protein
MIQIAKSVFGLNCLPMSGRIYYSGPEILSFVLEGLYSCLKSLTESEIPSYVCRITVLSLKYFSLSVGGGGGLY